MRFSDIHVPSTTNLNETHSSSEVDLTENDTNYESISPVMIRNSSRITVEPHHVRTDIDEMNEPGYASVLPMLDSGNNAPTTEGFSNFTSTDLTEGVDMEANPAYESISHSQESDHIYY